MSLSNDTDDKNITAFNNALDAQTNPDKLEKCAIDLRSIRVNSIGGLKDLPQLFVITLIHNNKNYDAYINNHVTIGDILCNMIKLQILTLEEVQTHYLVSEKNEQISFDLNQTLQNTTDNSRYYIQLKPSSSLPAPIFFIQTLTCKTLAVDRCVETDTIEKLKKRIETIEGVPIDQQRLIYKSKQLENKRSLFDYNIPYGSSIHLVLALRKPVIRLKSINNEIIKHVHVSIELNPNMWILSSIYPKASITNGENFIQWNDIIVYPDGKIIFEKNLENTNMNNEIYPLINDENEYRMLFWEALTTNSSYNFIHDNSLCVPRRDFGRILNYLLKKMTLSSEDRDDLITYVLPQLDEVDPEYKNEKIIFNFLSPEIYSQSAQLIIRPQPQQLIRAFLIFSFGDNDNQISTFDQLENEIKKVFNNENLSQSGLIVHEWGTMFIH